MENQTKESAISKVNNSVSSIFSRNDVIELIESIKCVGATTDETEIQPIDMSNPKLIIALKRLINSNIEDMDNDSIVDKENIELSLDSYNDNKIEITINEVGKTNICDTIENAIDEFLSDFERGDRMMSEFNEVAVN